MKHFIFAALLMTGLNTFASAIGPAGCGLGNVFIGGRDNQVIAATTNGTGTQTFGITSGTSNCVDKSGVAKLEAFVGANKIALANDVARGQGETLAGLSQVLRCRNANVVNRILKENYEGIFKSEGSSEAISNRIRETLIKESPVVVYCPGLS